MCPSEASSAVWRSVWFWCCLWVCLGSARETPCPGGCTCTTLLVKCVDLSEFPELGNLRASAVEFENCNLHTIPEGAFEHMRSVKRIVIGHSTVNVIERGAFRGVSHLQELRIEGREGGGVLDDIEEDDVSPDCWTVVNEVRPQAFVDMEFIENVYISKVKFGTLQPYSFTNVHDIDEFDIFDSEIAFAKSRAFSGLTLVGILHVRGVNVLSPESSAFDHIANVTTFRLESFRQDRLPSGMFSPSVARLTFRDNIFETMECGVFSNRRPALIDWRNNRIMCDCRLDFLYQDVSQNFPSDLLTEFWCSGPQAVQNQRLSALIRQEFLPCPEDLESVAVCPSTSNGNLTTTESPWVSTQTKSGKAKLAALIIFPILLTIIALLVLYIWRKKYFKSPLNWRSSRKAKRVKSMPSISNTGGGLANQKSIKNNLVKSQRSFIYAGGSDDEEEKPSMRLPAKEDFGTQSVYEVIPEDLIPAQAGTPPTVVRHHYDIPPQPQRVVPASDKGHQQNSTKRPSGRNAEIRYTPCPGRPIPAKRPSTEVTVLTDDDDYLLPVDSDDLPESMRGSGVSYPGRVSTK